MRDENIASVRAPFNKEGNKRGVETGAKVGRAKSAEIRLLYRGSIYK